MDTRKPLQTAEHVLGQFSKDEQHLLRPKKSVVKGMEAVIKLHRNNRQSADRNPFVSWTLNKVAVIDSAWLKAHRENMPVSDMDWWRVRIENETSPGLPVGCFIVRPLWKVERRELAILAPSTWTQVQSGPTLLLYPKLKPWMPWIIPKALRSLIMKKSGGSALMIPLSYPPEGEPDAPKADDGFVPLFSGMEEPEDMLLDDFMIETASSGDGGVWRPA
jgi:hypothetical protein